ncbi:phage recombination protein Bet [Companilactobacillus metriopterae]|uniref:phage recombination protein Bet n=1 Tax=Companilactobacillus metriopterae TaxID=1909267 RepID=UPI00100A7A24|nr:phage recombination protein Bet [Companilactobacillus metriopterae]
MADDQTVVYESNGEEINLSPSMIKKFLVSGNAEITDQETIMFLSLCKYQHLNPFLNEAYLVKFNGKPAQIIVSKEAFMKRAESNPQFRGFIAGVIVQRGDEVEYLKGAFTLPKDTILGAWAEVKRSDRDIDTRVEIGIDEFSKGQATWKSMPATMIRKTAIVNALREAFPTELGAMYTEDDKDLNEVKSAPKNVNAEMSDVVTNAADLINNNPELDNEVEEEFVEVEGDVQDDNENKEESEQSELL